MKHVGVRPEHLPLEIADNGKRRKIYYENFPDGSYKIWNARLLKSGCGAYLTEFKIEGNLVYCKTCEEWANINQFQE